MHSKIATFFSTKYVTEKIANRTLSETQVFIYFYLILMFDTISFVQQCLAIAGKQPTLLDSVNIWGLLIINAIGYIAMFLANGGSKGNYFLKKFFSFSFTVGYKYAILFFICTALLTSQTQNIAAVITLNLLMVANIGFRIYQTR
jgi:hypothetical protein